MTRLFKKLISLLIVLGILTAANLTVAAEMVEAKAAPVSEGGYIVKLTQRRPMLRSFGITEADIPDCLKAIRYTEGYYTVDSMEDIQALIEAGMVEYVEPNNTIYLLEGDSGGILTDPLITEEWYIDTLGMESAWDAGLDGTGVKVAVVDSGLRITHEDFAGLNLDSNSKSFVTGDDSIIDTTGHGTFVSGILSAQRNNGVGLAGLVDRTTLLELRCFAGTTTDTATIISALSYAMDQNVDVINMSFGGASDALAASLLDVLSQAADQGILLVAAAGNDGTATYQYPAALDRVVGVGMVDCDGTVSDRSQKNDSVFVTAPGFGIPGVSYSGDSAYISSGSGTSYATPMVSALAAMVKQTNKSINMEGFETLLKLCAVDGGIEGYDTSYGWGNVNAAVLASTLTADYSITYECGDGCISQPDYPVYYKIGRAEAVTLPTIITRSGWSFVGWYKDEACTGLPLTIVPAEAVGDQTYYAGWVENTDVSLRTVAVQGIVATPDLLDDTSYTVTLPSNSCSVTAEDFVVTPMNSNATVSDVVKKAEGDAWTFSVSLEAQNETYTVLPVKGTVARPQVIEEVRTGSATAASSDRLTGCVKYEDADVSCWFTETDEFTAYIVASQTGTGEAALDGAKLSYTPAANDENSTVVLGIRAQNGAFASTGTADVAITVDTVPVSDSTVNPVDVTYDLSNPGPISVELGLYGNNLLSVSENGENLSEFTDYEMSELPIVSPESRELTFKEAFLNKLSVGEHTLLFIFSNARTEASKTVSLTLTVNRTYTVIFQDGQTVYDTRSGVQDGGTVILPPDPVKSGYVFSGWYTGENGTGMVFNASTAVVSSLTVYANWAQSGGGISTGGTSTGGTSTGGTSTGGTSTGDAAAGAVNPGDAQETPYQTPKEEVTPLPLVWSNPYQDIAETDWYYKAVAFVTDRSLFRGTNEAIFNPKEVMTRGMLITVLYRLAGTPEVELSNVFTGSEKKAYYAQSMTWAVKKGIIHGYGNGNLGSNDPVEREQLATILFQYATLQGYEMNVGNFSEFKDAESVSKYARSAMQWASANGVIRGTNDQRLMPRENATRAEAAQMLMNFCLNVVQKSK